MVKYSNKPKGRPSKRKTFKVKYKIERKVKQHNKRVKKEARKLKGKGLKHKGVARSDFLPNMFPFKQQILDDARKDLPQEKQPTLQVLNQSEFGLINIENKCAYLPKSKDTFVNYNHSEQIFARLPLHDHKQIEYINGQHYEQRNQGIFASILKFMEQKFRLFSELTPRQLRISYCFRQEGSIEKPSRSLRRYEPKKEPQIAQEQQIQRPCSGERGQGAKLSELYGQEMHTPVSQKKATSDRLITLGGDETRQYQTQKKIEAPPIKITFGSKPALTRDCLRSKSKPNFSGKILQIVSKSRGPQNEAKMQNNENTEDCEYENHCNIISDKLKKRGRAHKEHQVHFIINREQPHANEIRFDCAAQNTQYASHNDEGSRKPQKLSMTAQQYKNVQINLLKGVVHLSPSGKKKAKSRIEQSKSMSNLRISEQGGNLSNLKSASRLNLLRMGQHANTQRIE